MGHRKPRLTYANVVATLALFIAVGGASAIAADQLARNSVGTPQLKRNAVTTPKIKNNAVTRSKIRANAVNGARVADGSLGSADLAAGTIPNRLGSTVTVTETIDQIGPNSFDASIVNCPAGYQAIGGGVDADNVFYGKVSESSPMFGNQRPKDSPPGQYGPATGWQGAVSTEGTGTGTAGTSRVIVICAPLG